MPSKDDLPYSTPILMNALPVPAWATDQTKLCNYFNRAWLDLTGRAIEQELGNGWTEDVHPDDLALCLETFNAAFDARRPFRMEYRLRRGDGAYRWFLDQGGPFCAPDGRFLGYVGICTDVTTQQEKEAALRSSEARHRAVLDALPDPVFVQDARGVYLDYHAPSSEALLVPPERFLGRSMREVLPPELARRLEGTFAEIAATREAQVTEYSLPLGEALRTFEARIVPCATGEIVTVTRDITERKQADEAMRQSEARLRAIFNNSTDAIFVHDLDGAVLDVNDQVLGMYRVSREQALRLTIDKDYSAASNPLAELRERWAATVAGEPGTFAWKAKRPNDGSEFDVEVSLTRFTLDAGKPVILANVRDITERKRADEEHFRRRQEELARIAAEQSVDDLRAERDLRERFVSLLTHDLRSPLTAATMAAELIRRHPNNAEGLERLSGRIISALGRADVMIRDMLDASRIRAGQKLALALRPCDLRSIVVGALEELTTIHGDRFVLEGGAAVEGHWDPGALRRVVENVCNNAIKYGAPHAPVTLRLERLADRVRLSINNQGEPLAADELETIFIPFRRVSAAKSGWGIGLTVVKGIIEAHGGTVSARSVAGEGTTFVVELPLDSRSPHLEPFLGSVRATP